MKKLSDLIVAIRDASPKAKALLAVGVLVVLAIAGFSGYQFYDYTQNNPNFCVSCHLMQESFDAWSASAHKDINCHDCHHLAVSELNALMISWISGTDEVPERHGKVIVPWKYCIKCHWQEDEAHPDAPSINRSKIHAKHYFSEQIECAQCHGYIVHEFMPEDRFCLKCHTGIEVHGEGMNELACLNCHTDQTSDLRPDRDKCLLCHGDDATREAVMAQGRPELKNYAPKQESIDAATKIKLVKDAPMQFFCYECHKPHEQVRPDWGDCLECHRNIPQVGKHSTHLDMMGGQCGACHEPHVWRVTEAQAKQKCTMCHAYKSPMSFIK